MYFLNHRVKGSSDFFENFPWVKITFALSLQSVDTSSHHALTTWWLAIMTSQQVKPLRYSVTCLYIHLPASKVGSNGGDCLIAFLFKHHGTIKLASLMKANGKNKIPGI